MFKYSFDALVYHGQEDVSDSIKRLEKYGYDAIELVGEPDDYNTKEVNTLLDSHGLNVSSICSIYNAKRDLAHPEASKRRAAVDYVKSVADMASEVNCPVIIVTPTANGKTSPLANREDERKWAVEGIREAAEYARKQNVKLCLEAWNRYETYWLNRLDQALDLNAEVGMDNVGIMGDTFHMNIEEENIAEAIRNSGNDLIHIHFADSNRAAPGIGHIDFLPALKALNEIDYQGHITFEILPASADPFSVMRQGGGSEFFDEYTKKSIDYIKDLESKLYKELELKR
ncbi:sugar phosphate isomerase/epimerase family protein [Metabacillus idriensis]|uniref:sugar phosphate isomerase/epimerase family protein n=1 Tax=Metabacillus idriensis TaxID=324768 RepID=UPI00174E10D7|nr:sugar phosphate isomerase/epimerase family protein [Metabacillus idriensis]